MIVSRVVLFGLVLVAPALLLAAPPAPSTDEAAFLPNGIEAATKQIAGFRTPAGMKVELFAAEPMLASPVAIGLDEKNRVYVAEEHRFSRGTEENRTRSFLLEDDLQVRTLADRLKMYQKWASRFEGGMDWFTKHADQVRVLEDTTGSGRANQSKLLAQFREPLAGLTAGVMATNGDVYITSIPSLWVIKKGTDKPVPLLTGFGVNCAFLGHDLHGLCWGPDGKLYFSVGDRGFDVTTPEGRHFSGPHTGAVFRCNPDGSEFEVVHRGLRNPQELAFDQFGNLFADDNNCDKGDHARLVYVVEGGESGWNMAYQTIAPHTDAPWFAERLWHLPHAGQPAYIVPPVGAIGTGPSGFLFTSGTSLPDRYQNSFLMCNYTGNGGLESFRVKPVGAGFEIADYHDFFKPIQATDAEFGYDGKLYISDFVNLDWSGKSLGGRIYTLFDPKKIASDPVTETRQLFAEGFEKLRTEGVTTTNRERWGHLLGHADQRVRLRTQFLLVEFAKSDREPDRTAARATLTHTAEQSRTQLARLHAIWGLGQLAKQSPQELKPIVRLLTTDPDAEVRAQAAKVLGQGDAAGVPALLQALKDDNARVKFFAAQSLGQLKQTSAVEPLFEVLRQNKDADAYLRHACVVALATIDGDAEQVAKKSFDASAAVRMGVVLVQRRLRDPRLVIFLNDPDPLIRTEAARAIHDLPLEQEYSRLAELLPKLGEKPIPDGDPLVRRSISAAYRLGGASHAHGVAKVIVNRNFSMPMRAEAIAALGDWSEPPPRDRVTGFWRPLAPRDPQLVRAVVEEALPTLFAQADAKLQPALIAMVQKVGAKAEPEQFMTWARDPKAEPNLRVAAMRFLGRQKTAGLNELLTANLNDPSALVRIEARDGIARLDAKRGVVLYAAVLMQPTATVAERQRVFATLPSFAVPEAGQLLDEWALKLSKGQVPAELQLDISEAVKAMPTPTRTQYREQFEAKLPKTLTGRYQTSLTGGDAERGREIFFNHTAAQCARCHTVQGSGGTAGPELTKVADKYKPAPREHFLESLLVPSAKLAEGYATVTFTLFDGRVLTGTILKENATSIQLQDGNTKTWSIPVADIEARTKPTSPMPSVEQTLTPREIRDLVEFLTTLK